MNKTYTISISIDYVCTRHTHGCMQRNLSCIAAYPAANQRVSLVTRMVSKRRLSKVRIYRQVFESKAQEKPYQTMHFFRLFLQTAKKLRSFLTETDRSLLFGKIWLFRIFSNCFPCRKIMSFRCQIHSWS